MIKAKGLCKLLTEKEQQTSETNLGNGLVNRKESTDLLLLVRQDHPALSILEIGMEHSW